MNTSNKALLTIGISVGIASGLNASEKKAQNKRPNIIFMMADDHAYQAISAYNKKLLETPNIDRLAKEGIIFTNACVSNSISAPSRATILTGKHCHIHGKVDNQFPFDTNQITFPQILQSNGYQTAMFGKLHFGNNPKGFDEFKILPDQGQYYNPDFITKKQGNIRVHGYVTDIITDMTLDWLSHERDTTKPFLLMYLHKAPHREWYAPERLYREFTKKHFPEPESLFDNYDGRGSAAKSAEMNLLKNMNWAGDSKIYPENMDKLGIPETMFWDKAALTQSHFARLDEQQRKNWDEVYGPINADFVKRFPTMTDKEKMQWRYQRYMQDYLACVKAVDENVGRLLDYLDAHNLTENTIIVYTSDQGFYLGEHGWFDKRFMYSESFKTPLLMRWPEVIKPQTVSNELVQNLDYAQTFIEAAKIKAPTDMQGESMMPILKGDTSNWKRKDVYYHYYEYPGAHSVKRHYGIACKEYKLMHFYYDIDEWEFYDLKTDPNEMKNQYNNPKYSETIKDLKERLIQLRKKYKDSEELDKYYIQKSINKK